MSRAPRSHLRFLLAIPLLCAVVATVLFLVQGGYGGGHGWADQAIGILGLPSTLMVERILVSPSGTGGDLLFLIWLPAVANTILWVALLVGVKRLLGAPRESALLR